MFMHIDIFIMSYSLIRNMLCIKSNTTKDINLKYLIAFAVSYFITIKAKIMTFKCYEL